MCIPCLFLGIANDCSKKCLQLSFVERICFRGMLVGHRTNGMLFSGTVYALVASHGSLKTSTIGGLPCKGLLGTWIGILFA